jgi:secondary thiamine-phosphate synthase enzyme
MRQTSDTLRISTKGRGLVDLTRDIQRFVARSGIASGLLTIFCRHTSASLLIQENADPTVMRDFETAWSRLAPDGHHYVHDTEGPDDMAAHLRTALTQTSLGVPVAGGRMTLGTWQAVYLWEHRTAPHVREIVLLLMGE